MKDLEEKHNHLLKSIKTSIYFVSCAGGERRTQRQKRGQNGPKFLKTSSGVIVYNQFEGSNFPTGQARKHFFLEIKKLGKQK